MRSHEASCIAAMTQPLLSGCFRNSGIRCTIMSKRVARVSRSGDEKGARPTRLRRELTSFSVPLATERDFELALVSACMKGWFYFLIHELQQWLTEKGLPSERAREWVFSCVEDCVAYSRYKTSTPIDELGRSIATPGTFTARGLEVLSQQGGEAAWKAAREYVFNQLTPSQH